MKMKKILAALLIMMSAGITTSGNDGPYMTVVSLKGTEVFKLIYTGNTSGWVKLNIFESQGRVIHAETIAGRNGSFTP